MIQNKVSANVMQNEEGDKELRRILTDYEKKFKEMEKDNENNKRLKGIIDKLQAEKEELNMRLLKANTKIISKKEDDE